MCTMWYITSFLPWYAVHTTGSLVLPHPMSPEDSPRHREGKRHEQPYSQHLRAVEIEKVWRQLMEERIEGSRKK